MSGMWELFRSLGFTSIFSWTDIYFSVHRLFFIFFPLHSVHLLICSVSTSFVIARWFSSCTNWTHTLRSTTTEKMYTHTNTKHTMFLIIFCSRAFSAVLSTTNCVFFFLLLWLCLMSVEVSITITPFAWVPNAIIDFFFSTGQTPAVINKYRVIEKIVAHLHEIYVRKFPHLLLPQ